MTKGFLIFALIATLSLSGAAWGYSCEDIESDISDVEAAIGLISFWFADFYNEFGVDPTAWTPEETDYHDDLMEDWEDLYDQQEDLELAWWSQGCPW